MTLVVGILTKGFAVISGDRRISRYRDDTGEIVAHHDSDNKCFLMKQQYLVGYCGVARFGGQRMEDWIASLLTEVPLEHRLETLREAVGDALHTFGEHRRIVAFMGVGFRSDSFSRASRPHAWIISNAVNPTTRMIDAAYLSIEVRYVDVPLPEDGILIGHLGETPDSAAVSTLRARIRQTIASEEEVSLDPLPILDSLAAVTIATAHQKKTVGSLVQVVNLPKPENDEEEGMTIWLGQVTPGAMARFSIGLTYDETSVTVGYQPAFVPLPGGAVITQGQLSNGPDELGPLVDPWETEET